MWLDLTNHSLKIAERTFANHSSMKRILRFLPYARTVYSFYNTQKNVRTGKAWLDQNSPQANRNWLFWITWALAPITFVGSSFGVVDFSAEIIETGSLFSVIAQHWGEHVTSKTAHIFNWIAGFVTTQPLPQYWIHYLSLGLFFYICEINAYLHYVTNRGFKKEYALKGSWLILPLAIIEIPITALLWPVLTILYVAQTIILTVNLRLIHLAEPKRIYSTALVQARLLTIKDAIIFSALFILPFLVALTLCIIGITTA